MISDDEKRKWRIKLRKLNHELSTENRLRRDYAILSGVCIAGAAISVLTSGVSPEQAVNLEIEGLQKWPELFEYFKTVISPGTVISLSGAVVGIAGYIKHNMKYNATNNEFYAETDISPEAYEEHFNGHR